MGFLQEYGLFSAVDCVSMSGHSENIKKYWAECERLGKTPFATDLRRFWFDKERIDSALAISRKMPQDHDALRQMCKKIGISLKMHRTDNLAVLTRDVLLHLISLGLAQVTLGIIPAGKKMIAAAIAIDVRSLLHIGLLMYATRDVRLKNCANPRCRKVFSVTRPDRIFCDPRCQNLVKVKRFRARMRRNLSGRP
jgi:predicted RNA-binding Zn ribbon-like protein